MSFKNALTKMGLVEEEVKVAPKAPAKTTAPTKAETTKTIPSFSSEVDPEINDMLQKSLQENKLSGFDYLKFISVVEKTKSSNVSEIERYKMAFAVGEELGVTKDGLVESGKHYLEVLQDDESEFNSNCSQYEKKEVKAKEAKISEIEGTIEDLKKQLADLQEQHEKLSGELEEGKSNLDTRKSSFDNTLKNFKANIESNLDKINQYL